MAEKQLEITERDEAGNVTATYIRSPGSQEGGSSRLDIILPEVTKSPWQRLLDVFLPAGYPHSVTDDYLEYQIYDSLQAFSSSIAGLLSSRAVLSGIGVGDSSASPTAALLLSILQESAGRIATILFAWRLGTSLEPECKMYRLLADILNDIAFILDCLSPAFPKPIRVVVLSFSSVLRALCGVTAGSAKASLSAHFARWGNLGELNAKDSSQETVISLLGMLVGSIVVTWVTTPFATWTALILLLSIHLETNRRAVRAVSMRTLNRQRATLVYHHIHRHGKAPTPEEISWQERIFERDGVLRDAGDSVVGYCRIGVTLSTLLKAIGSSHSHTNSVQIARDEFTQLTEASKDVQYLLHYNKPSKTALIVLKKDCTTCDQIQAWWHVLDMLCHPRGISDGKETSLEGTAQTMASIGGGQLTLEPVTANRFFKGHEQAMREAHWDLDTAALETHSGTRVSFES